MSLFTEKEVETLVLTALSSALVMEEKESMTEEEIRLVVEWAEKVRIESGLLDAIEREYPFLADRFREECVEKHFPGIPVGVIDTMSTHAVPVRSKELGP